MSTLRERLDRIYTPIEEAVAMLHTRRAIWSARTCPRFHTARRVAPCESGDLSPHSKLEEKLMLRPHAVLFRQVASPNFELQRFCELAGAAGLFPLVLEYKGDKFVDCNPEKYALARLTFSLGTGRNGGSRNRCVPVADVNQANGRPIGEVRTLWGQLLIEFHHDLLVESGLDHGLEISDSTAWFKAHGGSARLYYADFFKLFVDRAILFESFLLERGQKLFTEEIILPAFESVSARRGLCPLVCRLDPPGREGDLFWHLHPPALLPFVKKRVGQIMESGDASPF